MIPVFYWTKDNTQDALAADTTTSDNRSVQFTITSSAIAQLDSEHNGSYFSVAKQLEGNVADYEKTWNYTAKFCC